MADMDIEKIKRNVGRMIDQGAPETDIDAYLKTEGTSAMDLRHGGPVDTESGAGWGTRAIAGLYDDPKLRMQAVQKYYPDAKPEGDDNFVFTDPKSGKKTLFNPKGFDTGDVMSLGRDAATLAGSTLGAVGGTVGATPGLGTIIGAGAGGVYGGMAADKIADSITGIERNPMTMLKDAGKDFGINAVGEGVGGAVAKVLGPSVSRLTGTTTDELSKLAAKLNIPLPTRGTAFQNRGLQTLEQGVANTIGGAQIMENAGQRSLSALRGAVDRKSGELGAIHPDAESLGTWAFGAADNSLERLRQMAAEKYGAVYNGIEKEPVLGLANTQRTIQETIDAISDPAERELFLKDPFVQRALNLSTSPDLDVLTLKNAITDMRSKWRPGSAIDTATASEAQVNGILSSLGLDRDAAVSALGRGDALKAANDWYGQEKATRKLLEPIFGKTNSPIDLDLLAGGVSQGDKMALNAAEVGGKLLKPDLSNNQQKALQAILGDEYGDIAATRLARMADAAPGAQGAEGGLMSPNTFLTNWNKSARTGGEAVLPQDFDDVVKIAAALKDAEKMANTSGTARAMGAGAQVGALTQGVLGTVGAGAGYQQDGMSGAGVGAAAGFLTPMALAYALANPRMVTSPAAMKAFGLTPGLMSRGIADVWANQ